VLSWEKIRELILKTLGPEERESSVVYLDKQVLPPDSIIEIDRKPLQTPAKTVVAFVDLEPTANWGHDCRYLLLNPETGEVESRAARLPPFLRGKPSTLNVIWKGDKVPDWTVAVG
jgi:hypothetical protein